MRYARRRGRLLGIAGICAAFVLLATAGPLWALEVKSAGTLKVPKKVQLFAVATDPTLQEVLNQDFQLAHRQDSKATDKDSVTITVSVNQALLMPGVTLADLGPGDPTVVAKLLKEAGEQPPPVGDTGSGHFNPFDANIERQATEPGTDPMMQRLRKYQAFQQTLHNMGAPRFGPYGNAGPAEIYDTIIVARASASNSSEQMTVVAVVNPGDDIKVAKQLLAESIANVVLQ